MTETDTITDEQREVARSNLANEYLRGLAASKIGTPERYGGLVDGIYRETVSNTPSDEVYQRLFVPALMNSDSGATINEGYLKTQATAIIGESLALLPVSEVLTGIGVSEEVANTYADRTIEDLSDNEKGAIFSTYMTNMVESVIEERLPQMRNARAGALEEMLTSSSE
jgi:hypothetical protein